MDLHYTLSGKEPLYSLPRDNVVAAVARVDQPREP